MELWQRLFGSKASPKSKPKATMTGWPAAGLGRRAKGWAPSTAHVNALIVGQLETLRARSRDAVRSSPWAEAALESFVANVVGNGIRPKPVTGSEELRAQILDAWSEWIEEADADGCCDFYGLQALACREMKEAGEVFIRQRPRRRSDGLSVPMQLQMLEGDHLDSAMFRPLPGGRRIQAGIEFDAVGRRQAYHFWREHPGEFNLRQQRKVIVPADRVIHLFRVT